MIVEAMIGVTRNKCQIKASFVGQGNGTICVGACFQQMKKPDMNEIFCNFWHATSNVVGSSLWLFAAAPVVACGGRRGPHFSTAGRPVTLSRTLMHQAQVLPCRDFRS
jgi:hypothetical protein